MTRPDAPALGSLGSPAMNHHDAASLRATVNERTAEVCSRRYAGRLCSVILTGSLARREATWAREDNGWRLLGDAEFLVVFNPRATLPSQPMQSSVEQELQADLAGQGIVAHVQLSAVHPKFFRALRPNIFAYELRAWGAAVWGEGSVLSLIPLFPVVDVPWEDGWRLLANRMIEHLEATATVEVRSAALPPRLQYCTVKLCLDMATSLAVFSGFYAPSYRERQKRLKALADERDSGRDWPFPLAPFAEQVDLATSFKLEAASERRTAIGWEFWRQAIHDSKLLWDWELARLIGENALPGSDLMRRWMRVQPLSQRLRGWMFVARASGWWRSARLWPRWRGLAAVASPRYWAYDAGEILFSQLPGALEAGPDSSVPPAVAQRVAAALPVVRPSPARNRPWRWTDLVNEVAWNYHRFLEPTRS